MTGGNSLQAALHDLFAQLDLEGKGEFSRTDLHRAAVKMGWRWHEAPLFAILDLFTIQKPMPRQRFMEIMTRIAEDPLGPYGNVLSGSPFFSSALSSGKEKASNRKALELKDVQQDFIGDNRRASCFDGRNGEIAAKDYRRLLTELEAAPCRIQATDAALLIIDPQRSFTRGVWKESIGPHGDLEVKPIQAAFDNCARLLKAQAGRVETMFTRCPFPPSSYDWDDALKGIVADRQIYFIKPGNNVMFPAGNGFRHWVEGFIKEGKKMLVIGGCTLNSCVRVSAIETQKHFAFPQLQVVVDLSISGARRGNYSRSPLFGGLSAVESAVRQMTGAGVRVTPKVEWIINSSQ